MPREPHQSKHRFDATITNPRLATHTARARCGCGWNGLLPPGPLADAVEEWTAHVATAKKEERR